MENIFLNSHANRFETILLENDRRIVRTNRVKE